MRLLRSLALLVLLSTLLVHVGCTTLTNGAFERATRSALSELYRTEHFEIRIRPGPRSVETAEAIGRVAEQQLARICRRLEVSNDRRYRLFLFADHGDLIAATNVPAHVSGFAFRDAVYVGASDRLALVHELVHVVAAAKLGEGVLPALVEGLADAMLGSTGRMPISVHAEAAYLRRHGRLPTVAEMSVRDIAEWQQAVHASGYSVATSWVQHLIETHGIAKLKRYYLGEDPRAVYGVDLSTLERAWHQALDAHQLSELAQRLLDSRYAGNSYASASWVFLSGQAVVLEAPLQSEFTYEWRRNGVPIPGEVHHRLEIQGLKPDHSGTYTLNGTFSTTGEIYSMSYEVLVVPEPGLPED